MPKMKEKLNTKGWSRRSFLKNSIAAGAAIGMMPNPLSAVPEVLPDRVKGNVKNLIFMVSDGMSSGTLAMAELLRYRKEGRHSSWIQLYIDGLAQRSLMDMASLNSIVTDSAAAASSWGSGHRVNNGALNMTPDGKALKPILQYFKAAGRGTGCVTTATITHATPAGFAANMEKRSDQAKIAEQYLEREYDVMLGGGEEFFLPNLRKDQKDLKKAFEAQKIKTLQNKKAMNLSQNSQKFMGFFGRGHLPYSIDHQNSSTLKEEVPTLAEMTSFALEQLGKNKKGFCLQVEGARIDHAAHGNDTPALLYDQLAFDDAIAVVRKFAENRKDTLVIVTSDHGNANPGMNGMGSGYGDSNQLFDRIQDFKGTYGKILSEIKERPRANLIMDVTEAYTGIQLSRREARSIRAAVRGNHDHLFLGKQNAAASFGELMQNHTGVGWVGNNHTADFVEMAAFGEGVAYIPAFVKNTDLFHLMVKLCGVDS